jgi:DNA-binding MarR family transcriptional regulator
MDTPDPLNAETPETFVAELQTRLQSLISAYEAWYRHLVREHGVTPAQGQALLALPADQPMRMRDLASKLNLAQSTMTRAIDHMVAAGLVERAPNDNDRREVHVVCTERGLAIRQHLGAAQVHMLEGVRDAVPVSEQNTTLSALARLDGVFSALTQQWADGDRRAKDADLPAPAARPQV